MAGTDAGDFMPTAPRPSSGPTFEDLTFDDSLDDLHRIATYARSAIALQRLVHVRMMADVAAREGFPAAAQFILPLLDALLSDEEFLVRQHAAEQLRGLAEVAVKKGGPSGYEALLNTLLPAVARLLADAQPEVRVAAGETLVAVAGLVRPEDIGARVLTIVLQLAHDEEQEELRMTAAVLLNELSETLGPELCAQFVLPEVICLAEDPVFRVRKAAALNLDAVARTAGPSTSVKRLLPAFLRLAADDVFGVRKACAESLVAVSSSLDPAARVSELVPVCDRLLQDPSKWVRTAAQQQLGPFIATLPAAKVTPALLAHYCRLGLSPEGALATAAAGGPPSAGGASGSSAPAGSPGGAGTGSGAAASPGASFSGGGGGSSSAGGSNGSAASSVSARLGTDPADTDLAAFCAFSFPAVALKLGRARWPELRGLFASLSRDVQRKVRRPLAHALHELVRILGPDLAEAELLPALDIFLRDADDVRVGAIRSLASTLAALSPPTRESYLPVLDEVLSASGPLNWRFRHLLAAQLPLLAQIFSPAATFSVVAPFALRLLADPVACVREEAASGVAPLLSRLGAHDPALQADVASRLVKMASAHAFRDRQQFLRVCGFLGHATTGIHPRVFRAHFLGPMLGLTHDPVRNVRRSLADLLGPLSACAAALAGAGAGAGARAGGGASASGAAGADAASAGAGGGAGATAGSSSAAGGNAFPLSGTGGAGSGPSSSGSSGGAAGSVGSSLTLTGAGTLLRPAFGYASDVSAISVNSLGSGAAAFGLAAGANSRGGSSAAGLGSASGPTAASSESASGAASAAAVAGATGSAFAAGAAGSSASASSASASGSAASAAAAGGAGGASASSSSSSSAAGGAAGHSSALSVGGSSSSSAAAAAGGGASSYNPLRLHRLRAATGELPLGLDEDACPRWAWAAFAAAVGFIAPDPAGESDGAAAAGAGAAAKGGDSHAAADAAGSEGAASSAADAATAASIDSSVLAADVTAALASLADDDDSETASCLCAAYLQTHRKKPLRRPGSGAADAAAAGSSGASSGSADESSGASGSGSGSALGAGAPGGGPAGSDAAGSSSGIGPGAGEDVLLTLEDADAAAAAAAVAASGAAGDL